VALGRESAFNAIVGFSDDLCAVGAGDALLLGDAVGEKAG
jgi:hypothetical protein